MSAKVLCLPQDNNDMFYTNNNVFLNFIWNILFKEAINATS